MWYSFRYKNVIDFAGNNTRYAMMNKNMKYLISIALFFALAPLGGRFGGYGGHHVKFFFAAIGYCIAAYFFLKGLQSKKEKVWAMVILLAPVMFLTSLHIVDFHSARISLPSTTAYYIGAFTGLLMHLSNRWVVRTLLAFLLVLSSGWMWHRGYDLWLHKINFGTFSGKLTESIQDYELYDNSGKRFTANDFKEKLVLLDFWNTGCGVCFKKFPLVQEQYDLYKDRPDVAVYSVNIPIRRDTTGQAQAVFKKRGHTFPTLFASDKKTADLFGVHTYPTVVVLENGVKVLYRGRIEGASEFFKKKH